MFFFLITKYGFEAGFSCLTDLKSAPSDVNAVGLEAVVRGRRCTGPAREHSPRGSHNHAIALFFFKKIYTICSSRDQNTNGFPLYIETPPPGLTEQDWRKNPNAQTLAHPEYLYQRRAYYA